MNLIERVAAVTSGINTTLSVTVDNNISGIGSLAGKVATWAGIIGGALAFIFLLFSGILYVTANGNPEQVKKAQQGILNSIIGLVIIMLAYVIFKAVATTKF